MEKKKVAILGAGITGLVTAYYLKKAGIAFRIFEKSTHIGGVIDTREQDGFVYERGPNSGVIANAETAEFFEELGNRCKLEIANASSAKRLIWKEGKWHALPSGIVGGITTPLFSLKDKLRLLGEPFRKKGDNPNETLAHLVIRRMGQSFLDYAIDPFILGIYAGDPDYLVPKYALPKLYRLEQDYGSFIGGAIKKKREKKSPGEKKVTREIFSVDGGLRNLTNTLTAILGEENIETGCEDISVTKSGNNFHVHRKGQQEDFSHLVSTVNAGVLPQLFPFVEAKQWQPITNLVYAKVTEVAVGFKKWNGIPLDAFGGLIPFKEKRNLLGVLFMSSLFKSRVPKGGALLTTFVGGTRKPELAELNEEALYKLVKKELEITMGLQNAEPDLFEFATHQQAIAQYGADSEERFRAIANIELLHRGLYLAGSIRDGIGLADRIKQAHFMAEDIILNE
ncbi:MAG TPA: protoporphyrinogen oxidase [Bacteroidetes bacterium]|nr:protoporphyrinogen oxidase [Bacteroidota bacterium]